MNYKNNHKVVYHCKYHVVWCPKYRRKVLVDGVEARLKQLTEEICKAHDFELFELEIRSNQVRLLIEVDPKFGIHKAVKLIKGQTSRILRQEYAWLCSRLPSLWTNSYFVSTVEDTPLEAIEEYVQSQKYV